MRKFKTKTGLAESYEINRKNFEEKTRKSPDFTVRGKDGVTRNFAICPSCDNPIQLIGLYKRLENTDRPYGKHYNQNTKIAVHNEQAYLLCPYASHARNVTKEMRKEKLTCYEKEIYNTFREYFDLAVYILQEDTGLFVSRAFAEEILKYYTGASGYMYYWATTYNIPWMLVYFMPAQPLYGRLVRKGSTLHRYLQTRKEVLLEPSRKGDYDQVKGNGRYLNLEFSFLAHRRTVVDDVIQESVDLVIFPHQDARDREDQKEDYRFRIEINENRFPAFVRTARFRDQNLLALAGRYMPDLPE